MINTQKIFKALLEKKNPVFFLENGKSMFVKLTLIYR